MTSPNSLSELEESVLQLDPSARDCRTKIGELRKAMDGLCDRGEITVSQWRQLLDQIATVQSRCR